MMCLKLIMQMCAEGPLAPTLVWSGISVPYRSQRHPQPQDPPEWGLRNPKAAGGGQSCAAMATRPGAGRGPQPKAAGVSRQQGASSRGGGRGGEAGPRRSGAGSSPEIARWGSGRCAAGVSALRPPFLERPTRSCPILPHPGPLPTSQAWLLPDVRAAQGEPQQVESSAAHAQANEADHRDELWGRRRALAESAPSPSSQ